VEEGRPHVYRIVREVSDLGWLAHRISTTLDARGEVRDDASPLLAKLRRKIGGLRKAAYGHLHDVLAERGEVFSEDTTPLHNGRLVHAAGWLKARGGVIGDRLLDSCAKNLGLQRHAPPSTAPAPLGNLDLSFQLDGRLLTIRGHCDGQGTIVQDESGQPLLWESKETTVDSLALLMTLVPSSEVQVPLSKQSAGLLRVFPVRSANRIEPPAR